MSIQIKPIVYNELDELLLMVHDFYAIDKYPFDKIILRNTALQLINNKELGRIYIIKKGNNTIGYIVLTFGFSFEYNGRDAFIDELYIKEDYRNKGIGKRAIAFIHNQTKLLEINAIHLEVEAHNETAKKLYQKTGFKTNDRVLMTKLINNQPHL